MKVMVAIDPTLTLYSCWLSVLGYASNILVWVHQF